MDATVVGAIIGGGGTVILGLFGIVGVMWRGKNGNGKVAVDFVAAAVGTGVKIDALGEKVEHQHETLRGILSEQKEMTKAVVRVGTIIERNGGRT